MKAYGKSDECTLYVVVFKDDINRELRIQAWSDIKDYTKAYMEFHKCPNFKMKVVHDKFGNLLDFINENTNDEIDIYNLAVRAPKDHKKGQMIMYMGVPVTNTEIVAVQSESDHLMSSYVDYTWINSIMFYLKDKYIKLLKSIYLKNAVDKVIYNQDDTGMLNTFEVDELIVLYKLFPNSFGK